MTWDRGRAWFGEFSFFGFWPIRWWSPCRCRRACPSSASADAAQHTWQSAALLTIVASNMVTRIGWSAPSFSQAGARRLWDIVEIGLGGYVIGRSAEKVLPGIVGSMKES